MPDNPDKALTSFNFENADDRTKIMAWLDIAISRISMTNKLEAKDLQKTGELLSIIAENNEYHIPRKKGQRRTTHESWIELCCWHVLKTEKEGHTTQTAIQKTAEALNMGIKTVEKHYYTKKKKLLKLIDKIGFQEASSGFEYHLNNWKSSKKQKT